MPYIVNNSDGTLTVTVADSVVDTSSYSLALIGRNVSNYGQYFAQNTIRHLENFASSNPPTPGTRLVGQLWFDKQENLLRVWDGNIWKRATNIVVGSVRPTSDLTGGGTAFFNTENNKLEVHNGTGWKLAGYAGEVTNRYQNDGLVHNASAYGTKIRSIFLKDTSGISYPVLAISYVKTTSQNGAAVNEGSTLIDGHQETIMALFSDFRFTIDTSQPALVDGVQISDLVDELIEVGGIAEGRDGRLEGEILKGFNQRAEFEAADITRVNTLFADTIGGPGTDSIDTIYVSSLNIASSGSLTVGSQTSVVFGGDLQVDGTVTVGADMAVTGEITVANLVVSANTVLNGTTTLNDNTYINGNLWVDGVQTQNMGTDSEKIEQFYGNVGDLQSLVVDTTAGFFDATVSNTFVVSGSSTLEGSLTANGAVVVNNTLSVNQAATINSSLTVTGVLNASDDILMGPGANIELDGGTLIGSTTQVDLEYDTTNNNWPVVYVDTITQGPGGAKIDTDFYYNPNSETLHAPNLATIGDLVMSSGDITMTGDINVTGEITASANITTGAYFVGTATAAQYADLAEIYASDEQYEPGTVVKLGGSAEITQTTSHADTEVFGVISTDPAYLMNKDAEGLPVALTGRVPVKVIGKVKKGERLISSDVPGVAWALADEAYDARAVIGRALQSKEDGDAGVIEAVIGVK